LYFVFNICSLYGIYYPFIIVAFFAAVYTGAFIYARVKHLRVDSEVSIKQYICDYLKCRCLGKKKNSTPKKK
jgi:hypothetical protein